MKSRLLIAFILVGVLLVTTSAAHAQAPAWEMVTGGGQIAGSSSFVQAMTTDAQGNVYLAGQYRGRITLGAVTLFNAGDKGGFVAKWSPVSKGFVWAHWLDGSGDDQAYGIAVSGNNVYVVGDFVGTARFGPLSLTSTGGTTTADGFLAKITDTGVFAWVQRLGGSGDDAALTVAVAGASVYVAGSFASATATFGSATLTNTKPATRDIFVTKLVDTGNAADFVWAQRAGGDGTDIARSLLVRGTSVYLAGSFGGMASSGTLANFGAVTLASVGGEDAFVARLTDSGLSASFDWVQGAGGSGIEGIYGMAVNGSSVYVAGQFRSSPFELGTTSLTNRGSYDGFVAKLTDAGSSGSFTWAQPIGGTQSDGASMVAVHGSSIYVSGSFASAPASFGRFSASSANGVLDAFVTKLIDTGSSADFTWVQRAGSGNYDYGRALVLSGATIYLAGNATPPSSFGALTFTGLAPELTTFLASLTDPTITTVRPSVSLPLLVCYPNPAHHIVQVPSATTATELILTDTTGRTMRTSTGATLSVLGLAPGLYALCAATPGQPVRTARLVVE